MSYMFYEAKKFNSKINFTNTNKVEIISSMFQGASSFNQELNLNFPNIVKKDNLFKDAENIDLSKINIEYSKTI